MAASNKVNVSGLKASNETAAMTVLRVAAEPPDNSRASSGKSSQVCKPIPKPGSGRTYSIPKPSIPNNQVVKAALKTGCNNK